jgi:hypothetical protein
VKKAVQSDLGLPSVASFETEDLNKESSDNWTSEPVIRKHPAERSVARCKTIVWNYTKSPSA